MGADRRKRIMPTIEIISIGCQKVPTLPRFRGFAYQTEDKLVSHRGLFQSILDKSNGVIVHLANKSFEGTDGFWFAGDLINWDSNDALQFRKQQSRDVRRLMETLLASSPTGEIIFLTDYQFGPSRKKVERKLLTLDRFWKMHDAGTIRFNALYRIKDKRLTLHHRG